MNETAVGAGLLSIASLGILFGLGLWVRLFFQLVRQMRDERKERETSVSTETRAPEAPTTPTADYESGRWCGECRWGVVEDPECCFVATDLVNGRAMGGRGSGHCGPIGRQVGLCQMPE